MHSCLQCQCLLAIEPCLFVCATGSATVSKKARFPAYASHEELGQGLKKGRYFKGALRVNAHDRSQAYVTIPGLPSDLMIRARTYFVLQLIWLALEKNLQVNMLL